MESIEMSVTKQPIPHGSYIVKAGDSLMSIAARVGNVTPAQLARFNRLGMLGASHPPLFPGQRLYIPNKDEVSAQNVRLRHVPGTATRVRLLSGENPDQLITPITTSLDCQTDTSSPSFQEGVMERLFVKVKSKRVLLPSKSEIDGLLIVTPDAVCFDALATASALNRANAVKRQDTIHLSNSLKSSDMGSIYKGSIATSTSVFPLVPPELILEAAEPVHDVVALSVCIPIASIVSLNTHGDMHNLLTVFYTKDPKKDSLPKELSISSEIEIFLPEKSLEITKTSPTHDETKSVSENPELELKEKRDSAKLPEKVELPEEVYISIGVDTEKISSSVAPTLTTPNIDHTTISEAASTSLHVFKIPLEKLAEIHDILVSATNLFISHQSAPAEAIIGVSASTTTKEKEKKPVSIIEAALMEMENAAVELTFSGATSSIINDDMLKDLTMCLPASRLGSSMNLIYSTATDGFSLNALYRKTKNVDDISVLLIRDQGGTVFGALLSEKMRCSQRFYGTGESCVFHWRNGFKVYNWTRKNHYFMQGSRDSFLIGVKNGHSAIWFDGDLKYGRSEATDTFDNPVLCSLPKPHISPNRNSSTTTWANSIPSSCSYGYLRGAGEPTSVAFVITALELWEIVS